MSEDAALRAPIPPSSELLAVEHPCYVVNVERGVRMLGGPLAVARASAANADYMECFLRPNDPLSHPLFGVMVPTPGVVLKVTRRKPRQGTEGGGLPVPAPSTGDHGGQLSIEVVGTVSSSYRFEGLADYQYVSDPALRDALDFRPRPSGVPYDLLGSLQPVAVNAMRVPPALFSMHDTPLDYLPRSQKTIPRAVNADASASLDHGAGSRGVDTAASLAPRRRRRRARGGRVPMHFGQRVDFTCGPSPSAPLEQVAKTIDQKDELYCVLKSRFAQRPVWSRQALRASLPASLHVTEERLKFRLPQLAYYFSQVEECRAEPPSGPPVPPLALAGLTPPSHPPRGRARGACAGSPSGTTPAPRRTRGSTKSSTCASQTSLSTSCPRSRRGRASVPPHASAAATRRWCR